MFERCSCFMDVVLVVWDDVDVRGDSPRGQKRSGTTIELHAVYCSNRIL